MTCLDCLHCKEQKGIVKCVKGNWFDAFGKEVFLKKGFVDTAPKAKKTFFVRRFQDCKDFVSSI